MNIAVICYSFTKNNLLLANEICRRTDGTLFTIQEVRKRSRLTIFRDMLCHRIPRLKDTIPVDRSFDHYVLVAPVWGQKIATPLTAFLMKESEKIESYSFISICAGGTEQQQAIENELTRLTKKRPLAVAQLSLKDLPSLRPAEMLNYQIDEKDLQHFDAEIEDFTCKITINSTQPIPV